MTDFPAVIDLGTLDGSNGFRLDGIDVQDYSGRRLSAAGDVNGDGFADIIIGAFRADPNGNSNSGESYVIFGKAGGFAASFDLAALDGANGFRVDGIDAFDQGGVVSGAGDVNGDGFDDIIVGAFYADPGGRGNAGETYVIFGQAGGFAPVFFPLNLTGSNGFRLDGIDAGDRSGEAVASAGDVNGDGFADIIIGAPSANSGAGEAYVVFGKASGFAPGLNLSGLDGVNGFRMSGPDANANLGSSVSAAGDINGDGFGDILIGASGASPDGVVNGGASYIVFGKATGFAASFGFGTLNGSNGFRIDGIAAQDRSGTSVSSAGDVNGDGLDDIIIGAHQADPGGDSSAGASYVVFGQTAGFGASLDLSALDGSNGFRLDGLDATDFSGFSVSGAGDVNGDGFDDILIGAFGGDPNSDSAAGESYVVFGKASAFGATVSLSALNGANGFRIDGIDAGDESGFSVSRAGDVNGDGFADIVIGAHRADPGGDSQAGESYVIFGRAPTTAVNRVGSSASQLILGGAFNDTLDGRTGADTLIGGDGNDSLIANGFGAFDVASDRLEGGAGDDTLAGSFGNDILLGGSGADLLNGNFSSDSLDGGSGDDTLGGGVGNDTLIGAAGSDRLEGGDTDDNLDGGVGNDTLIGDGMVIFFEGNDMLAGGAGDDSIEGNGGDDTLEGGAGIDTLDGGDAIDTLSYRTSSAAVFVDLATGTGSGGDAAGDVLSNFENIVGSGNADTLRGDAGDNVIEGGGGADSLNGRDGIDTLSYATSGAAVSVNLTTGAGSGGHAAGDVFSNFENILGSDFDDTLEGDAGDNVINGGLGDDLLLGRSGNDTLFGRGGRDTVDGGGGDDRVEGFVSEDSIVGGSGNDTVFGNGENDTIDGGSGDDRLFGGVDNDTLLGGDGGDSLNGAGGIDRLEGGSGDDTLLGGANSDVLYGDAGNDTASGNSGGDVLYGGGGDDELRGNNGDDRVLGEDGNDDLFGGDGDDTIVGGAGLDTLAGRADADRFVFNEGDSGASQGTADLITDFSQSDGDRIVLSAIDAITGGGDNAFTFIGEANAFTGTAGELRYRHVDGETRIFGDTDGDGVADFALRLDGTIDLVAADFVL